MKEVKRIQLWSGPRNVSTALMYSFAQRPDTKVFDEPLYGYYLNNSPAKSYHPGAKEVLNSMELDGNMVVEMMLSERSKEVLFFKQMTHHLLDLDKAFMKSCQNLLLSRDPREMLPSFAKEIETPSMKDVGYADHMSLIEYFNEHEIPFVVLDSKRLLEAPERVLKELCNRLDIPFYNEMLKWEPGARDEDGVWAKYWYQNVHRSEGFQEYQPKTEPFPEKLKPLLDQCMQIYKEIVKMAI